MKKLFFLILLLFSFSKSYCQDLKYVRGLIDTLSSPAFFGRGYVNNGDKVAANYIRIHLIKNYAIPFTINYYQPFSYPMNTFPGEMQIKMGETSLIPGVDYLIDPASPGIKGNFNTVWLDENTLSTDKKIVDFGKADFSKKILIIDSGFKEIKNPKLFTAKGLIFIKYKDFCWTVSGADDTAKFVSVNLKRTSITEKAKKVSINIQNKYFKKYDTQNVAGFIKGSVAPDTFVVFTAHYDHLGKMGANTYFPGANDNASGVALLLDLAKYYSKPENKPYYSIAFLFFTGEEAGLYGSNYFSQRPLFPLNNVRFLINFDMVGTGSDGIKVVNGSVFKKEYDKLVEINNRNNYLKTVAIRGEAANSDHYYFYKKGVKSIFIYTLGNEHKEYHTIGDKSETLPLTKYESLFHLTLDFINSLSTNNN